MRPVWRPSRDHSVSAWRSSQISISQAPPRPRRRRACRGPAATPACRGPGRPRTRASASALSAPATSSIRWRDAFSVGSVSVIRSGGGLGESWMPGDGIACVEQRVAGEERRGVAVWARARCSVRSMTVSPSSRGVARPRRGRGRARRASGARRRPAPPAPRGPSARWTPGRRARRSARRRTRGARRSHESSSGPSSS